MSGLSAIPRMNYLAATLAAATIFRMACLASALRLGHASLTLSKPRAFLVALLEICRFSIGKRELFESREKLLEPAASAPAWPPPTLFKRP